MEFTKLVFQSLSINEILNLIQKNYNNLENFIIEKIESNVNIYNFANDEKYKPIIMNLFLEHKKQVNCKKDFCDKCFYILAKKYLFENVLNEIKQIVYEN